MQARHWPVPFFMDEALPLVDYYHPNQKIWRVYSNCTLQIYLLPILLHHLPDFILESLFIIFNFKNLTDFHKTMETHVDPVWVMGWATRRLAEGHKFNFVGRTCIFCFVLPMLLTEKTSYSTKNTIHIYHDDQKGDAPFLWSDFNSLTTGRKYLFYTWLVATKLHFRV